MIGPLAATFVALLFAQESDALPATGLLCRCDLRGYGTCDASRGAGSECLCFHGERFIDGKSLRCPPPQARTDRSAVQPPLTGPTGKCPGGMLRSGAGCFCPAGMAWTGAACAAPPVDPCASDAAECVSGALAAASHDRPGMVAMLGRGCVKGLGAACEELANALEQSKKEPDASNARIRACGLGRPSACAAVASRLVEAGEVTAAEGFASQGCWGGDVNGCLVLGLLNLGLGGHGVNENLAWTPLTKACDGEVYRACGFLGSLHSKAHDYKAAAERYEAACKHGEATWCASLGFHYARGEEADRQKWKTARAYEDACSHKDPIGCREFARILRDNFGDPSSAATLFATSCMVPEAPDAVACRDLGEMLVAGWRQLQPDEVRGLEALRRACDLQDARGCTGVGFMEARTESGIPAAKTWFERGCKLQDRYACRWLEEQPRQRAPAYFTLPRLVLGVGTYYRDSFGKGPPNASTRGAGISLTMAQSRWELALSQSYGWDGEWKHVSTLAAGIPIASYPRGDRSALSPLNLTVGLTGMMLSDGFSLSGGTRNEYGGGAYLANTAFMGCSLGVRLEYVHSLWNRDDRPPYLGLSVLYSDRLMSGLAHDRCGDESPIPRRPEIP